MDLNEAVPAAPLWTSFISVKDAGAGIAAGMFTDAVFYGLDSYKVQAQAQGQKIQMSRLFRGLVPSLFIGTAPTYGAFFILYQPLKNSMDELQGTNKSQAFSVMAASIFASVPASLVYVPCDVIKKRMVLPAAELSSSSSSSSSALGIARDILRTNGVAGFFVGWQVNLVKDVAFGGLKISLYEGVARVISFCHKGPFT